MHGLTPELAAAQSAPACFLELLLVGPYNHSVFIAPSR